jgi:uracil-DNA glycosylase family 4
VEGLTSLAIEELGRSYEVRAAILECRRCGLHQVGHGPVPFRGRLVVQLAVVGEAPGPVEDEVGAPFVGPSGRTVDETFVRAGIDPRSVFVCNAVSCYPKRTPDPAEQKACTPNLMAQLALTRPEFILLLGGVALKAFKGQAATVGHWCDRAFPWEHPATRHRSLVWPTYHPKARSAWMRERMAASILALGDRMVTR